ncbi:intercellular adhesion molecule 2 isoform X1 [Canis lupus baileyi]|uniref:intercellular adhesion molecule 2 isoform X1 n=1 Tax=Canis lupus familiaris TaxID=9615 RepID=UPI000DC69118|nr:intercellular adhesion molecule 2 isoform X1 [Canis lupus familiaris]XP_048969926.1 intercellular adhesion molecule 2 isoform X1 [Canis lupus dingo]
MRPRDGRGPQRTLPFDCRQRETKSSSSGSGDCEEKCYHALSTLFWTTCRCFPSASSPQPCRKGIPSPFDRRRNRFRERKHLAQRHTAAETFAAQSSGLPGSGEVFEVHTYPEQLAVKPGESQFINCSTSCSRPEAGGLETILAKTLMTSGAQWKEYMVSNISQDTIIYCYFTCFGEQRLTSLNVSVFYPPTQVLLKLQPTWVAVGRPFTIKCHVPAVKPLESLTLMLLRGQEVLHNQTFWGTADGTQGATATHNSTAHREDGLHNFSCQAILDLRSLGGNIIHRVSEPQMLKVYEPRPDNQMVVIISVVSVLLFLFVTSILLCFVLGQHWRQRRMGTYGVQGA